MSMAKSCGDPPAAAFGTGGFDEDQPQGPSAGNTDTAAAGPGPPRLLDKTNLCTADAVPVSEFPDAELRKLEQRIAAEKSKRGLAGGRGGDDHSANMRAVLKKAATAESKCHKTQFEINVKKAPKKKWRGRIIYKIGDEDAKEVKRLETALGSKEPKMNQSGLFKRAKAKWEARRRNESDDEGVESDDELSEGPDDGVDEYVGCDTFPGLYQWARKHYFGPTSNHDTILLRITNHWSLPEAMFGTSDGQKPACLELGRPPRNDAEAADEYNSFILDKIWKASLKEVNQRVNANAADGPVMRADVSNVMAAASARGNAASNAPASTTSLGAQSHRTACLLAAAEQRTQDELDLQMERMDLNARHDQVRRRRNAEEKNAKMEAIVEKEVAEVANEAEAVAMEEAVLQDEEDKFDKLAKEDAEVADEENWSAQEQIANVFIRAKNPSGNGAHHTSGAFEENANSGGTASASRDLATVCKFAEDDYVALKNEDIKGYICAVNLQGDGKYLYDVDVYWKGGKSVDGVILFGMKEDALEKDPDPTHLC